MFFLFYLLGILSTPSFGFPEPVNSTQSQRVEVTENACPSLLSYASRDLWPRKYSNAALKTAKTLFYPFVATAKLGKALARWAAGRTEGGLATELGTAFGKDIAPFAIHFSIFLLSQSSLTTYSAISDLAPPTSGVVVVIEGYHQGHPLRDAVKAHFERSYSHLPKSIFIDLPKRHLDLNSAIRYAYQAAKMFGPVDRLEVHADMCPGRIHVNSDPMAPEGLRDFPRQIALQMILGPVHGDLTEEDLAAMEKKKNQISADIQQSLMAPGGEIVLYGCSVLNGERGDNLGGELEHTFLAKGGNVIGPAVDLYRDYPDYLLTDLVGVQAPAEILSPMNRAARYYMATVYLGAHAFKAVQRGADSIFGKDYEFDVTFAVNPVRQLAESSAPD